MINQEFHDYLILSGFKIDLNSITKDGRFTRYSSGDVAVVFGPNDIIIFDFHDEGDESKKAAWSTVFSFVGVSQLGFFNFALLLHITGTANLKNQFKKSKV